jgi:hypothetical protein
LFFVSGFANNHQVLSLLNLRDASGDTENETAKTGPDNEYPFWHARLSTFYQHLLFFSAITVYLERVYQFIYTGTPSVDYKYPPALFVVSQQIPLGISCEVCHQFGDLHTDILCRV